MVINLSEVVFENDFFNIDLPDGSVLTLNKIDEDMAYESINTKINRINLQVSYFDKNYEEKYLACPCAIGLGNDILIIKTEYPEYEGKVLTSENMRLCTIEVYE